MKQVYLLEVYGAITFIFFVNNQMFRLQKHKTKQLAQITGTQEIMNEYDNDRKNMAMWQQVGVVEEKCLNHVNID